MDQYIGTSLDVRSDKDAGLFQVSRRVFTDPEILASSAERFSHARGQESPDR